MKLIKKIGACFWVCLLLTAVGCGRKKEADQVSVTSLFLKPDGQVVYSCVESFDETYYKIAELSNMAMEEAINYNVTHAEEEDRELVKVETVDWLSKDHTKVLVTQVFQSPEVFADYSGAELFLGTIEEALLQGYDLSDGVERVTDDSFLSPEQMQQKQNQKVLITDVRACIYLPQAAEGINQGVYTDGMIDATQTEGLVVVLLEDASKK